MSGEIGSSKGPKPFRVLWLVLAFVIVLAGLALFFPVRKGPIIETMSRTDLEMGWIHAALEAYKSEYGTFPAGDSTAVFQALRGENPRHTIFLWCSTKSVSADGSMRDPWGTSYKVYFSGHEILVRSAGPNKRFDDPSSQGCDDCIR